MDFQNIVQDQRKTRSFLLLLCFLTMIFPLTAAAEEESVQVTLSVEQTFTQNGSSADVSDVFSYNFIALDNGNPMPSGTGGVHSFTIAGSNVKDIGPLTFTNTGIYLYELRGDLTSPAKGYIYDTEVYQVMIFVKRTGEKYSLEMVVEKSDGDKAGGIKFENNYTPHGTNHEIMVDPPVRKTVSGNPPSALTFTFTLTARDTANPMPEGCVNGVKEMKITGSGENDFGTWSYTKEGTYLYDIAEVINIHKDYTYDKAIYTITDIVKDVDGQLMLTRTVTNESGNQVSSCIFINQYTGKRKTGGGNGDGGTQIGETGESTSAVVKDAETTSEIAKVTGDDAGDDVILGGLIAGDRIYGPKVGDDLQSGLYTVMLWLGVFVAVACIIYLIFAGRHNQEITDNNMRKTGGGR